jgi:hypothetical protein
LQTIVATYLIEGVQAAINSVLYSQYSSGGGYPIGDIRYEVPAFYSLLYLASFELIYHTLLGGLCDGIASYGTLTFSSRQLVDEIPFGELRRIVALTEGPDSPVGCGESPSYSNVFDITRLAPTPDQQTPLPIELFGPGAVVPAGRLEIDDLGLPIVGSIHHAFPNNYLAPGADTLVSDQLVVLTGLSEGDHLIRARRMLHLQAKPTSIPIP